MTQSLPALVMGFREGLEAFLLVAIMLQYVTRIGQLKLKIAIYQGVLLGILVSLILGILLSNLANFLGGIDAMSKAWESLASLFALFLVTIFIIWMIKHSSDLAKQTSAQMKKNFSNWGLMLLTLVIVGREGAEIAIFSFAGKYDYSSVILGIILALILTYLIFKSLVKINISLLFRLTLAYLILQAGYLLGYAIHEGASALKSYQIIHEQNWLFIKAYDLSTGLLDHKSGLIGLPIHIAFGWYSKPEWLQFFVQYCYSILVFIYWYFDHKKRKLKEEF